MHDDRAGEIMELFAIGGLQPGLNAEGLIPGDPFKERVDEGDDEKSRGQLRIEPGALGDTARNDGRDGGREGEQKEELG